MEPDSMGSVIIDCENKHKAEYLPGAKRQELLEQVPEYLLKPGADPYEKLKLTETEYLEALNKATNVA